MAVTTGMMLALSTGLSVVGQIQQGKAQNAAAQQTAALQDQQAAIDKVQAERETVAAMEEAKRIRKAGQRQASAAAAQLAASGIMVDSGSAININEDISGGAESDAMNTLLTGKRRSESYKFSSDQNTTMANQTRAAGSQAQKSSILSAAATGAQGLMSWRGVKASSSDPIGNFYQRGTRGSGD